jgi:DNA-binding NarL/FixJ family response regulator
LQVEAQSLRSSHVASRHLVWSEIWLVRAHVLGYSLNTHTMPAPPTKTRKISVCLLANHPLVLAEFKRLLSHFPVRVQPQQVECPLANLASIPRAGIYVVDFEGNRRATEDLVAHVMERSPDARLLLVGSDFSEDVAFPLLRLGVKGLLQHAQLPDQLPRALQSIASGGYWVPRTLLSRFVDSVLAKTTHGATMASGGRLSRREKEVIQGLLDNLSNKEIGSRLNISERTVKFHVSNILQKFGVRRRADLIVLAYQEQSRTSSFINLAVPDGSGRLQ